MKPCFTQIRNHQIFLDDVVSGTRPSRKMLNHCWFSPESEEQPPYTCNWLVCRWHAVDAGLLYPLRKREKEAKRHKPAGLVTLRALHTQTKMTSKPWTDRGVLGPDQIEPWFVLFLVWPFSGWIENLDWDSMDVVGHLWTLYLVAFRTGTVLRSPWLRMHCISSHRRFKHGRDQNILLQLSAADELSGRKILALIQEMGWN